MHVYCMECEKIDCNKVKYVTRNGFVFVDLKTGRKKSDGQQISAGYHTKPKSINWAVNI